MTEPKRTDNARLPGSPDDRDRVSRIEELLVSGLDHYFAADYEQAINIWTRVVFLERDHDRARAYIERARSAIAERQRETEELLQGGKDAYKLGDIAGARDLLTRAVDRGAPSDEALVLLDRLDRLDGVGFDAPLQPGAPAARSSQGLVQTVDRRRTGRHRATAGIVVAAAALGLWYGGEPVLSWLVNVPAAPQGATVEPDPLPVLRAADTLLDRARSYYAGGHLYDALRVLDGIAAGDPVRPDADRLKAEVQRDLLTAAAIPAPEPREGGGQ